MGGYQFYRRQDRLYGRDAAALGTASREGQRRARGGYDRRAGANQSVGARGAGTAPGQRDSAPGIGLFCPGGARPPVQAMKAFIDQYRDVYGVEPICKVLPIAPSTYRLHAARQADPDRRSARAKRDERLREQIPQVWNDNFQVYGARKVWRQLRRDGVEVARCTVERLMRQLGLKGVRRGQSVKTTVGDQNAPSPLDRVNRQFTADCPNTLWVSDLTYVSTWQGFVYVAFVIDVFARYIVGWKVSRSARTDFVLDALEQALYARQRGLIQHSDRGVQYVSIRYTERLAAAGIEASVGSVGDSYDNALAETINGL